MDKTTAKRYTNRIKAIFEEEGLRGVLWRIKFRYFNLLLSVMRRVNATKIRSSYGVKLKANWDDTTFRWCVNGGYGRFLSDFLFRQTSEFEFIDIGANQGLYTILAAKNSHCRQVYAFEPVKATAALLRENILLNEIKDVDVIESAINSFHGESDIRVSDDHSGAATLRNSILDHVSLGVERIHCIDAQELNRLVRSKTRCIVKIDVEGLEDIVLEELSACEFFGHVSDIFYEVDRGWISEEAVTKRLKLAGFTSFQVIGDDQMHFNVLASRGPSYLEHSRLRVNG